MKNFKLIYFLILFQISVILNAYELEITGLKKLNLKDIKSLTEIDLSKDDYNINEINEIVKSIYDSEIIYDVDLNLENKKAILNLTEAKIVNEVFVNGNIIIQDQDIISLLKLKKGSFLNLETINLDLSLIKLLYETKGYPDIAISVVTESHSIDKVNIIFQIQENNPKKINNIKFLGNSFFTDKFLSNQIYLKPITSFNFFDSGSNFDDELFSFDKNKIISLYKNYGFLDIKINYVLNSDSFNNYTLSYYIEENKRYIIEEFEFSLIDKEPNQIIIDSLLQLRESLIKQDGYLNIDIISNYLKEINDNLFSLGIVNYYYDYQTNILKNQSVELKLIKVEFKPTYVNQIFINGNSITKDYVIRSKLPFEPGDVFIDKKLIDAKNLLEDTKYINLTNINYSLKNNLVDIVLDIDENKKTGSFLIAGSFSGDTGFGFSTGISDSNFLGSGNELKFNTNLNSENVNFNLNYFKNSNYNPLLQTSYSIFNEEKNLTDSFGYKLNEFGLSYFMNFKYNKLIDISSGVKLTNSKGYDPLNSNNYINDNIDSFYKTSIISSLSFNSLDDLLYPKDGHLNSIRINITPNEISDHGLIKINLSNENYKKIKNSNSFLFFNNKLGYAKSLKGKLRTRDAFSLGGLNFPGFDYRGIGSKIDNIYLGGNNFFKTSLGYGNSFIFDKNDNINYKIYYTSGSIWGSDYIDTDNLELRSSIAASIDILTPLAPIVFTYSIPIEKNDDDKLRKFNFSIGTNF